MKRAGKGGAGNFLRGQVNFGPKGAGKNKTYDRNLDTTSNRQYSSSEDTLHFLMGRGVSGKRET